MCRHCRRYFRQLRLTIDTLRRVGASHPSVDAQRVLQSIERAARR
jgi:hypothetical protein